jgi:hypothetical protein
MTTTPTNLSAPEQVRASESAATPPCWCGQDLADVHRDHCPRCGRTLARHVAWGITVQAA